MAQPINKKNAIESATFVVVFEREFDAAELQAVLGLELSLKNEFPSFDKMNRIQVNLDGQKGDANSSLGVTGSIGFNGVLLQRFTPDGKRDWAIQIAENTVVVSCYNYDSWLKESQKALRYIQESLKAIRTLGNPVAMIVLQTIDHFISSSPDGSKNVYQIGDIFDTKSPYFTPQATQSGQLWHVFQGWFEDMNDLGGKCLHVLNISNTNQGDKLLTSIDHAAQLQLATRQTINEAIYSEKLQQIFDKLHELNKDIIRRLLCETQRQAIGL